MRPLKKFFWFSHDEDMPKIVFGATDAGKVRKGNEDYFLVRPEKNLYIAADGMGGHKAGAVASLHATRGVDDYFTSKLLSKLTGNDEDIKDRMVKCLIEVNRKILRMAESNRQYHGMGCAIVVALVDGDSLYTCHVGDARAYVCDAAGIKLITTDHSHVMELVKAGKITMEEARKNPTRNHLTQAIGPQSSVTPDQNHYCLKQGDRILLCSDGLWDMLSDQEIHEILAQMKPAKVICAELIQQANNAGGRDNITAVVVVHGSREKVPKRDRGHPV